MNINGIEYKKKTDEAEKVIFTKRALTMSGSKIS